MPYNAELNRFTVTLNDIYERYSPEFILENAPYDDYAIVRLIREHVSDTVKISINDLLAERLNHLCTKSGPLRLEGQIVPHMRYLVYNDRNEVLQIASACSVSPRDQKELHQLSAGNLRLAASYHNKVVGFTINECRSRSLHLLSFVVDPEYQRKGIGVHMMLKLMKKLSRERRNRITCDVRESNLSAQLFLQHLGFTCISILRESQEDVYTMQYTLPPSDIADLARENRISKFYT